MIVPDWRIQELVESGHVGIDPFNPSMVQPASIDLRLGPKVLRIFGPDEHEDWLHERSTLEPGYFALGSTVETIRLPADYCARFEGKSTLGRIGLATHVTAGFIDPGFRGQITVELVNHSPRPVRLTPGMRIGQLCLMRMTLPCLRPYGTPGLGSHYQGQTGPTPAVTNRKDQP